ncbi:hydrogenase 2 maturation endopeptidase [Bacteroidia bacterium]|nr:hydrogenase 2 maturation endopeptidase [Bacteroidia bacterium]GHU58878.1 hydrogenase 2 maturation endopeptidase [Bacteroidia bacterium]
MKTLVLGVGNILLKDEGVGIHVARALAQEALPPDVTVLDGGTGGLHLLSWLEGYERIILVDATLDGNPPGTIRHLHPHYASDYPPLMSAHEIGLRDMIEVMLLNDSCPEVELFVISVLDVTEPDLQLTPAVEASIPVVVQQIIRLLKFIVLFY